MDYLSRLIRKRPTSRHTARRKPLVCTQPFSLQKKMSDNALKVAYQLHDSGHAAYLVGGSVRDILLGLSPKDFDVATSALPEQVRSIFRNSRIIGRRFKLIHVLFGREIIEVATFRAGHSPAQSKHGRDRSQHSHSGRILRDNVYGSLEDDAVRRDFTINALYYAVHDSSIRDFCGGLEDIERKVIRLIGDPELRYREDPVRMLRAVRFAAKLNFSIAPATANPIKNLGHLLLDIPAARLFDETLKLFLSGQGERTLHLMYKYGLVELLFPAIGSDPASLADDNDNTLLIQALRNTDKRVKAQKPVTPAFFYAALLWTAVDTIQRQLTDSGTPAGTAIEQATADVIAAQNIRTTIPRRFGSQIEEIWALQRPLERRHPRQIDKLASHPRFRAAYDLLVLRATVGEQVNQADSWWTQWQEENPRPPVHSRQESSSARPNLTSERRVKKRRRRRPNPP